MPHLLVDVNDKFASNLYQKTIWACLLAWIAVIPISLALLTTDFFYLSLSILLGSVIVLPVAILKDIRTIDEDDNWPRFAWAYDYGSGIGSIISMISVILVFTLTWGSSGQFFAIFGIFMSPVTGVVYIWQRIRHTNNISSSDTDTGTHSMPESSTEDSTVDRDNHLETYSIPDTIPGIPDVSAAHEIIGKEPIGGGGNADVFKTKLSTPNREITLAIKEPRISETLHTDQIEDILQEAETWNKLDDHDHIVGVVDYGSDPLPWIAMEYMDGGHLGEYSGEMEISQALWTAISVTKGVRHAHRRGVAHLDLKPENVLVRTIDGSWDVPKVADWGLSKHLLEHSKSIEGFTPTYSAPEQLDDGFGEADDITDVYQLGAVFYELFTGQPPFEGDNAGEIIRQVLNEEPTPPSKIADLPEELDRILLKALEKEKDDRYESVLLLRDDLQELFDSL